MDIAILGTGNMAHAIATRMLAGGHNVTLYTRDLSQAPQVNGKLMPHALGGAVVKVAALGSPLTAPVVISALYFRQSAASVVARYADQLKGKVLIDIANSVNETSTDIGLPGDTSVAEELAKLAPGARVVKAFNTTFAGPLDHRSGQWAPPGCVYRRGRRRGQGHRQAAHRIRGAARPRRRAAPARAPARRTGVSADHPAIQPGRALDERAASRGRPPRRRLRSEG